MSQDTCNICYDYTEFKLDCNHYYCINCLKNWFKINENYKCCICTLELSLKDLNIFDPRTNEEKCVFYLKKGNLKMIKKLKDYLPEYPIDFPSRNGHLEVVKYLHETVKATFSDNAMNWASQYGHLEVVKYLHEEVKATPACTELAMNWASQYCHLEVVKYLHETVKATPACTESAMDFASLNGHLE